MRLLLSLILTSFVFFAPQNSGATELSGKKTIAASAYGISEMDVTGYSEYGRQSVSILHYGFRHTTNQHRSLHGSHPDHTSLNFALVGILLPANSLQEGYTHCIPIGMKLLFPKHYFW